MVNNDDFLKLALNLDLQRKYGISNKKYYEIHHIMSNKYNLKIKRTHFARKPETKFRYDQKTQLRDNKTQDNYFSNSMLGV